MMLTALLKVGSLRTSEEIGSKPLSLATICTLVSPALSRALRRVYAVDGESYVPKFMTVGVHVCMYRHIYIQESSKLMNTCVVCLLQRIPCCMIVHSKSEMTRYK